MRTDWTSKQHELTDPAVLETAIRSSAYLQYMAVGVDLSHDASAEFKTLIASEIEERLNTEAEVVSSYTGLGGYGDEFPIDVMCWGGIFFVDACEFPRLGYYLTLQDAQAEALHIAECYPIADEDGLGGT